MPKFACCLCEKTHLHPDLLINHLKVDHGVPTIYKFVCNEENCKQNFHNIHKFKKHLGKHTKEIVPDEHGASLTVENVSILQKTPTLSDNTTQSLQELLPAFKQSNVSFLLDLHNNTTLPRNLIQNIQNSITERITLPIAHMLRQVNISEELVRVISNPFLDIDTEYKFFKELEKLQLYKPPIKYTIANDLSTIILNHNPTLSETKVEITLIDIQFQIQKFLESEGVLKKILSNMKHVSTFNSYYSFLSGSLWKNKNNCNNLDIDQNCFTLPIFLYSDDFEVNDPLGSKSGQQKVCGFYYSFPSLPKFQSSKMTNIFVAGFIKTQDLKDCGLNISLTPLIEIFKKLQVDGLNIKTNDGHYRVHIEIMQILGDNLGLNTLLGYNNSFSSNYFCRICKRHKKETGTDCVEIANSLRNFTNYEKDVSLNDPSNTGIKNSSVFNTLPNFHVTSNIACDIMHDVFLGVCKYNLSKILHYFVYGKKYFSLQTLNYRKQMFQYGDTEIENSSPSIQKHHIENSSFKMSAKQMKTFVHFVLLMIGDLVDAKDSVYKFLIHFIKLIDILLLPNYDNETLYNLQLIIKEHNETYQKLFKENLKPKFHNLVHYPNIIRKLGPLKYFWSFRFESQHQLHKQYARSITSRLNISLSLAIKSSLRFANCVLNNNFFQNEYVYTDMGPIELENYYLYISLNLSNIKSLTRTNSVVFRGINFKIGHIVTLFEHAVSIYEISDFLIEDKKVYIIGKQHECLNFAEKYQSYLVGNATETYKKIKFHLLQGPPIHFYMLNNGLKVIRLKKYW